ncbi:MAG: tRNA dihydrouridine synthase DusB [Methylococcaceae bacterium]
MQIGSVSLQYNFFLAPMAGITDRPFRQLCKEYGAGLAVSEMVSTNPQLRHHRRTLLKADHTGEREPRVVQILGADPKIMADAAIHNVRYGAQIIDINMGCPAKKVCSVAAGSSLLKNEALVKRILDSVVNAVDVPVTLKMRTGWEKSQRNAVKIAQIAENSGISALTIHGRTRECAFTGHAEYDTIKAVKQAVKIPVIANGDIVTPQQAKAVLEYTQADAIMIGRGAQGRPWLFKEMTYFFETGQLLSAPKPNDILTILLTHLEGLYHFYGSSMGVRIGRKHIKWYLAHVGQIPAKWLGVINKAETPLQQTIEVKKVFAAS